MATGHKTGGRKKGTPNKLSISVKENVIAVFHEIGGIETMTDWARGNPTQFYALYCKLLPTEAAVTVTHKEAKELTDDELNAIAGGAGVVETPSGPEVAGRVH